MAEQMTATVSLETGMRFDAEAGSRHHVTLDAAEHDGGQNTGFRPMELRKKRQQVSCYEVHVSGIRAEDHPMVFVEITVEHIVTGYHVQPEAVARAIQLSKERYCGAGAMLGKVAHVSHTFRIVEAAETQPVVAATLS